MISLIQAAELADRLWHVNRDKFYRECGYAREMGITLLELIQWRIETRMNQPYETYEVEP